MCESTSKQTQEPEMSHALFLKFLYPGKDKLIDV